MRYSIARDGKVFGPYTAAEVARYLASGNILPSDLAQMEGSGEWLPVEEFFPAATSAPAVPRPAGLPRLFPDPPDFPWWAVLLLTIVTGGLFSTLWGVWQAAWLRKLDLSSSSLWLYVANAVVFCVRFPATLYTVEYNIFGNAFFEVPHAHWMLGSVGFVLFFLTRFTLRMELERHFNGEEPIGLKLGGWMTLFFGTVYFQYHFNRINEVKRTLRVSVPGE